MSISTCVPASAKVGFLSGIHTLQDNYKLVLYTSQADLGPETTHYTPNGEASGKGYKAGGLPLKGARVWEDRGAACLTFESLTIPVATITARGYMVVNASKGNRVVFIADWGAEFTSTEGPFNVRIAADMIVFD